MRKERKSYKNGREHEEEKMKRKTDIRIKLKDELIDRLKRRRGIQSERKWLRINYEWEGKKEVEL